MRLTEFFNLSIAEVEKYLESYEQYKKFGLTGFSRSKNIRLRKKSNIYGVYEIRLDVDRYGSWIVIYMIPNDSRISFMINPNSFEIMRIGYNNVYTPLTISSVVDKTKKLKDFVKE